MVSNPWTTKAGTFFSPPTTSFPKCTNGETTTLKNFLPNTFPSSDHSHQSKVTNIPREEINCNSATNSAPTWINFAASTPASWRIPTKMEHNGINPQSTKLVAPTLAPLHLILMNTRNSQKSNYPKELRMENKNCPKLATPPKPLS